MIELLPNIVLKDYNASVANKEGLQLATEGANVSYTIRIFIQPAREAREPEGRARFAR